MLPNPIACLPTIRRRSEQTGLYHKAWEETSSNITYSLLSYGGIVKLGMEILHGVVFVRENSLEPFLHLLKWKAQCV